MVQNNFICHDNEMPLMKKWKRTAFFKMYPKSKHLLNPSDNLKKMRLDLFQKVLLKKTSARCAVRF